MSPYGLVVLLRHVGRTFVRDTSGLCIRHMREVSPPRGAPPCMSFSSFFSSVSAPSRLRFVPTSVEKVNE